MNAVNMNASAYFPDAEDAEARERLAKWEREAATEREAAAPVLARTGEETLGNKIALLASGINASHTADPELYERDFLTTIAAELQGLEVLAFTMESGDEVTGRMLNGLIASLRIRIETAADLFWQARQARAHAATEARHGS